MQKTALFLTSALLLAALQTFAQEPAKYLSSEPAENKNMKPEETEYYTPVPPVVTPGKDCGEAPSDAIVLFDGKNLNNWVSSKDGGPAGWTVSDGAMTTKTGTGPIHTKQSFGDCQLHVEWRTPNPPKGTGQDRGNSGIFLQSQYELQVLDSYHASTYVDGQAGSIYKDSPPLVNACRPPGVWQTYDIFYTAPRFNEDGSVKSPAYETVLQNGVLIQNHVDIKGQTLYVGKHFYKKHGDLPLELQDHNHPVSYRNIWIRKL
ncbi:DUF1080 domain-containing protein [Compostibacter hankyongensis]|uniref:DUF1080 domain-containing protein n=1 Tax=Compostibacter hankyongensis TaxID=1007089 RepID=A0ABP8FP93_9BACT